MLLAKETLTLFLATAASRCLASSLTPKQKSGESILSFPLLPHHAVVERRRRELRSAGIDDTELGFSPPNGRRLQHRMAYYETQPQISELFQGYGTHYMDLYVGTPPQRQTVIIDTADFLTAFPCSKCLDCGEDAHTDPFFNETASRTFEEYGCGGCMGKCVRNFDPNLNPSGPEETCLYEMDYGTDGSFQAHQVKDVAYPGGLHDKALYPPLHWDEGMSGAIPDHASAFTFRFSFGCKVTDTGLFKTQLANGIAGMAPSNMAFWHQMKWDSVVPDSGFSLCFAPHRPIASKTGTESGAITIGGTDARLHNTPMLYAKDFRNASLPASKYNVGIRKVYLRRHGGESVNPDSIDEVLFELRDLDTLELNRGGVVIDSFTTGTYMRDVLEGPFRQEWNKIVDFEYTNDPLPLTAEDVSRLPTILLQLVSADKQTVDVSDPYVVQGLAGELGEEDNPNDIVVAIPPQHYMLYNPSDQSYHASFRFLQSENAGAILGANFLMGHDVHFDVDDMRVGFSESTCEYDTVVADARSKHPDTWSQETESSEKTTVEGRNNWNSKCGGWCVYGKLMAAIIGGFACVGCFRVYKKYQAKQQSNENNKMAMPGMNERGEQWSPDDKKSVMPGRIVEKMPPLPSMA